MDIRKIAVGGALWFAGIIVPVFQHGFILLDAAIASSRDTAVENFRYSSIQNFYELPRLIWVYVAVMWAAGALLIVSGLISGIARKP